MSKDVDKIQLADDYAAQRAAVLWGLRGLPSLLKRLENCTYLATSGSQDYIIRITGEAHRSAAQIDSELDWISYLASNGVTVSAPVRSRQDRHVESISTDQGVFYVTVFDKAPGELIRMHKHWHRSFTVIWAR